jgi:hypothetical protein
MCPARTLPHCARRRWHQPRKLSEILQAAKAAGQITRQHHYAKTVETVQPKRFFDKTPNWSSIFT